MNKSIFSEYLNNGLERIGFPIHLNCEKTELFFNYIELLESYNQKFNLTGIRTSEGIIEKHFIESLLIYPNILTSDIYMQEHGKMKRIIDVGSGAGLPGIPLKIIMPLDSFTLVESTKKKSCFLEQVGHSLGLKHLEIISDRAEKIGHAKEYRETYHIAVSRALAKLSTLIELCIPFLKTNGIGVFLKGNNISQEMEDANSVLQALSAKIENISPYTLPYSKQQGHIIIVKKYQPTSLVFPRKVSKIGKHYQ
ncbi:16S rRNA (guanine(527)-N(7))-methyltransferase RsmG [Candidatus Desantisbacteria bacterium]|nr:16S rRNA (guanine(527)-N(7))-methyltransferase RsmG [Candidatus Desantisbacteria bacterium]